MPLDSDQSLSPEELQRYHRHLILPDVGEDGQRRLKAARVLLVGAGGLGSPIALYLAAAGVGHLGVIDADVVDTSNLQRQVLFGTRDVGKPKVAAAETRLHDLNPHVSIASFHAKLTSANALDILRGYDIVVDGSDNFPTRYLVNDACVLLGKPNVHGSVIRFDGQATVFGAEGGPCYRCLFPEPPAPGTVPNCAEGGVFGVLPGLIGVIQATETIKLITGAGESLVGRLLLVDALRMRFRTIELEADPECRACGTHEITTLQDYDAFCGLTSGSTAATMTTDIDNDAGPGEITPARLDQRLRAGHAITVVDVREPYEWSIARIGDARLIPLNSLPQAAHSLSRDAEIVVYCHHGMRSEAAAQWLGDQGFNRVLNLVGGIDRWSLEVDPSVRRY
ncbi:MAG: UBA/THIF-type binding, MoeZ/MoeB fmaily protein [Gemmatimonadetes bacterium]|nr:UBA/THIF-type binding, MoeZ/MoeB fmaily protein [Gemmatimonadota bacterium]